MRWQETQSPTSAIQKQKSVAYTGTSTSKDAGDTTGTTYGSIANKEKTSTPTNSSSGLASAWETDCQHDETESFASASAEQWDVTNDVDVFSAFGESEWSTPATSEWDQEDLSTEPSPPSTELKLPCNASASEGACAPPAPPKSAHETQVKATAENLSTQKGTAYDIEPSTLGCLWVGSQCEC